jgi:hypothetical protein
MAADSAQKGQSIQLGHVEIGYYQMARPRNELAQRIFTIHGITKFSEA